MTDLSTVTYGFVKPTVGGDADAWGGILNTDLDSIDSTISTVNLTVTHVSSSLSTTNSTTTAQSTSLSQLSSSLSTTTSTTTANTANISAGSTSLSQLSSSLSSTAATGANVSSSLGGVSTSLANVSTSLGAFTTGTNANALGYLGLPQVTKSAGYTNVLTDMGKEIFYTSTATQTIDSNANVAAQIGSYMVFTADVGVTLTVSITTDTLRWPTGNVTGSRTVTGPGYLAVAKKKSTEWWVSGGLNVS